MYAIRTTYTYILYTQTQTYVSNARYTQPKRTHTQTYVQRHRMRHYFLYHFTHEWLEPLQCLRMRFAFSTLRKSQNKHT